MLHPHLHLDLLIATLDYTAIAVASIGGALHALRHSRYQYDFIGVFGLAIISALGGGITRDLLLGQGPPLALIDIRYLYVALAAAAVTLLLSRVIGPRMERFMLYIDAASVALFAVAGTTRAQSFGLSWLPAIALGLTTAVGGGSLRDVLSGSTPRVFERGNFYAIAALAAALIYLLLDRTGLPDTPSVLIAVACGFTLRMLSVHLNWRTGPARTGLNS